MIFMFTVILSVRISKAMKIIIAIIIIIIIIIIITIIIILKTHFY